MLNAAHQVCDNIVEVAISSLVRLPLSLGNIHVSMEETDRPSPTHGLLRSPSRSQPQLLMLVMIYPRTCRLHLDKPLLQNHFTIFQVSLAKHTQRCKEERS